MNDRYFQNNYPDYKNEHNQLTPEFTSNIIHWIQHHLHKLEQNLNQIDPSDGSVYTGQAGIALLYMRLSSLFPEQKSQYMSKAKTLIDLALKRFDGRVITFLCGASGPLAIGAVIYHNFGDQATANKYIEKIVSLKKTALNSTNPDEYLYGRAGYLYSLLFLQKELGQHIIDTQLITEIFQTMITSGEKYARQTGSQSPLMYKWYDTEYLGAAHGVSGIVYLLLKITQYESFSHLRPYVDSHLIPTVEFLKTKRLSTGNYMSSNDSKSDKLVQWCHGAPGFIYLFVRAYEITGNSSYIEHALAAGDVVWERGILTKGYGLCHGTAGNGYVFLNLYRITHDLKWLHRAIKFAEFCLDYGKHHLPKAPDTPYSLFEGLAGTIYFMADILNPIEAQFPAFE